MSARKPVLQALCKPSGEVDAGEWVTKSNSLETPHPSLPVSWVILSLSHRHRSKAVRVKALKNTQKGGLQHVGLWQADVDLAPNDPHLPALLPTF